MSLVVICCCGLSIAMCICIDVKVVLFKRNCIRYLAYITFGKVPIARKNMDFV